jgi:predicted phage-related endonuclease
MNQPELQTEHASELPLAAMIEPEPQPEAIDVPSLDPRARWLEERRTFIGGSEAFQLLNQEQYGKGCSCQLAFEKLNVEPDFPLEIDEDLMKRGTILEPIVAQQYMEETGRKVICAPADLVNGVKLPRARRSREFPWAGVHVDRTILAAAGTGVEETGDLEIKSRAEGPFLRVMRQKEPFPGDILQVQWANFVTGHSWGAFAMVGVFGSLPMRHFDIQRHEQVIEVFKREGDRFAECVWGKGHPPDPPLSADDTRCKICPWRMECRGQQTDVQMAKAIREQKKAKGDLVTIEDPALAELCTRRLMTKAEIKAMEGQVDQLDQQIIALQGDRAKAYVLGFGKNYLYLNMFNGIDQKRLKDEKPEVYEQYFVSRATGGSYVRQWPDKE